MGAGVDAVPRFRLHAFRKNEERLQRLRGLPSEIVRAQIKVTPYPHEDVGWIIANTGPEVCMFSSDYPTSRVAATR